MLNEFINLCKNNQIEIHQMTCYKNNELLFNVAIPPYSINDKQQLYSLSKSFTSTGIGFAVDEGLLRVSDKICDIFADELKNCEISNYAKKLTVQDCLTMRTGHSDCAMMNILKSDSNPILTFMTKPFNHLPGTYFIYNTGATYILSAVITKLTGETLFDYLTPRLFEPLGIINAYWRDFKGVTEGGYGLHISSHDAAQLGLLYYNKGIYNGKRLLSTEWVEEATSNHADNAATGGILDWGAGYGYQFWRCYRGGYRGDGAYGQLCLIKDDIVFAMLAETPDMQKELDCVFAFINDISNGGNFDDTNITPYPAPVNTVYKLIGNDYFNRWLKCGENPFNWSMIKFEIITDTLIFSISNSFHIDKIKCGIGEWIDNGLNTIMLKPVLDIINLNRWDISEFAACYTGSEIIWRYKNSPHVQTFKLAETDNGLEITIESITNPPLLISIHF